MAKVLVEMQQKIRETDLVEKLREDFQKTDAWKAREEQDKDDVDSFKDSEVVQDFHEMKEIQEAREIPTIKENKEKLLPPVKTWDVFVIVDPTKDK